ncbi:MAG: hypothetical protein ACE5H3_02115 [Planctomycetota bacterium]
MLHRPVLLLGVFLAPALRAAPQSLPASHLPREALLAVEAPDLSATLEDVLGGEAWKRFREGELGQFVFQQPQVQVGLASLGMFGNAAGAEPQEVLQALTGGGAAFALLPAESGPQAVLLFRALDPDLAQDGINAILNFVTGGATRVSGDSWRIPLPKAKVVMGRHKDLFVLSNAAEALDRLEPAEGESLADVRGFQQAREATPDADLRLWIGDALLHGDNRFVDPMANFGGVIFAGGVKEVLHRAPWACLQVNVGPRNLRAELLAPADAQALDKDYEPFFPDPGEVEVPRLPSGLATLVVHRRMGPIWTSRDLYLTERGLADTVEADGTLSLLYQRDYGPEILHWLEPEFLLVGARTSFPMGRPEVEFPAGALRVRMRKGHPEDLGQSFVNAFLGTITFTNFDGNKGSRGTLQIDMEALEDGSKLYTSSWKKPEADQPIPPRYNLSPAMLLGKDGAIWLSSSTPLLKEIARSPQEKKVAPGDRFELDFGPARKILEADREALVAQQTLEQGGDVDSAQAHVDRILAATRLFDRMEARSHLQNGFYRLSLEIRNDEVPQH